jgi:type II secretion system protein N
MQRFWQHPKVAAALQYGGYTLFFVVVMVLAVPWTFPTRQLRTFIAKQARQQGYPLEMDELRLTALGGVEVGGLRLTLPGKAGEPIEGGAIGPGVPEVELKIERISAKVALLPLLFGRAVDVRFDIEAGGGSIADGRVVKKGEVFDFEIGKIDGVSLAGMGVGKRALGPQTSLLGDLDGALGGKVAVHYGGTPDDLTGAVELELADAILRSPELSIQGGLQLQDLGVGTFTLKVKMALKQQIAALAASKGAEKATVIHIEQMQAEGDQLELVTEETSHILIPPGKAGWKQATIQLHFAFALPDKPSKKQAKEANKEGEEAKPSDRVQWAKLLTLAGKKLAPFERGGYIGIGCTGSLARPQCRPELPQVTVGGRSARLEGQARPGEAAGAVPAAAAVPADPAAAQPAVPAAPVEFRTAVPPSGLSPNLTAPPPQDAPPPPPPAAEQPPPAPPESAPQRPSAEAPQAPATTAPQREAPPSREPPPSRESSESPEGGEPRRGQGAETGGDEPSERPAEQAPEENP